MEKVLLSKFGTPALVTMEQLWKSVTIRESFWSNPTPESWYAQAWPIVQRLMGSKGPRAVKSPTEALKSEDTLQAKFSVGRQKHTRKTRGMELRIRGVASSLN